MVTVRGGRIGPQSVRVVTAEQLEINQNRQNARAKHKREEMNHKSNVLTTFVVLGSLEAFSCWKSKAW